MFTALLLVVIAVVAVFTFPRKESAGSSSEGNLAARASSLNGTSGHRSRRSQSPAISKAKAEQVLSSFWRANNEANRQRSDSLLATIEAGSSYTLDDGAYCFDRASHPSGSGYIAFAPVHAVYFIPRQSVHSAYPHWFVAAVTYANLDSPQRPTGSGYLLFSQAYPGAAWKDVLEPDAVPGSGPAPHIATDAQGYAIAVNPGGDVRLSITPREIGPVTAAALDNPSAAAIKVSGDLTDLHDQAFWRLRLPAGSADNDRHRAAPGRVFGLRTKDGGAILFYFVDAELTLEPPPGETFELEVPGYYSPGQTLTSAGLGYIEQFAAYDPPQGRTDARIVAEVSGIVSRD